MFSPNWLESFGTEVAKEGKLSKPHGPFRGSPKAKFEKIGSRFQKDML